MDITPSTSGAALYQSRWAQLLEFGFFLGLTVAGVLFWHRIVVEIPVSFWGFPWDWPVMSLAQAVNIDFWIREPGHRTLSQAQYYQPGLWFQFASFAMYRATSGSGSPRELFDAALRDPEHFWAVNQAAPVLLTLVGLVLLWRYCRNLPPLARCAAVSCYFVSLASLQYSTYQFFNESFSLPIAALFFPLGLAMLAPGQRRPLLNIFLCGLAASGLYLHKMNYVVWPAALIPALFAAAWAQRLSWRDAAIRSVLLVAGIVIGVVVFGYLLLSRQGLQLMLDAHKAILFGSGIYGSGAKTFVSFGALLANLGTIWTMDRWILVFLAACAVLAIWQIVRRRHDADWLRRFLPEAVFLYGAAGVMLIAVLKHFQPYYVVSFVAVFPFLVVWQARAGVSWGAPVAMLLTAIGLYVAVPDALAQKQQFATAEIRTRNDREVILARQLPPDRDRLWMYRSVDPACGRLFLLSFIGIYDLMKDTVAVQGPELFMSPWHSSVLDRSGHFADMKDLPWQMIVVDKDNLAWIDKLAHPWFTDPAVTRTDLSQVVLFERK
ncbi:hypothetical protein [Tardiphaga sp. OK245]|uniref:hypothetical protein n=1 Tax=Tardiphaga sp. OK245 TaxID=1855306 RepID=UPI0008A7955F|nr:hypothetical protein [Tardiphaga sp. OK245]SEI18959.1 hypothetical protein SAMN05216367_4740 [Tardiphaga sp. OK245]